MSLSTSPFLPDITARLRLAGSSCLRRWRAPRAVKRDQSHRRFDALMVLLVIAAVVVVAIQTDAGTARWVPGLSAGVKAVFGRITYLGLSGYMFALTGLALFGAIMARGRGRGARFDRACLSVSICSAIRALQPDHAKQDGWPLDLLHTTVVTLADGPLKTALEELLRMSADV